MMILIKTSHGDMKLELYPDKCPKTVENFLKYAADGHYHNTIFHRVIPQFMIQGGGFDVNFIELPTMPPIVNEAGSGISNLRGTISMARTSDINSATSQFFINIADNTFLDHQNENPDGFGYCAFGKVVDGMDVADSIVAVETGSHGPHEDVPTEPVVINSVTVID